MAEKRNKATSATPQIVVLVIDDSGSMKEKIPGQDAKAQLASEGIKQVVMEMQATNLNASASRYFVSLLKFGDEPHPIVEFAGPGSIRLPTINFTGTSGSTNMQKALIEVEKVLQRSLARVRSEVPRYRENDSPPPLVLFFSDGENTGGPVGQISGQIHALAFAGGKVMVIAVGIGMQHQHFAVMRTIASDSNLAVNIDASDLTAFLAEVGTTFVEIADRTVEDVVHDFRR